MRIFAPIFILALIAGACSSPEQMPETSVSTPVSVIEVGLGSIEEYVTATGTVEAASDYTVTSEAAGYYRKAINPRTGRPFAIGDTVLKDEVIVYLDNEEQVKNIDIETVELDLELSKAEYEQNQMLIDLGGVTERDLLNAEKSLRNAQLQYDNALLDLEKFKVKAPFSGLIVDMPYYTSGIMVSNGSDIAHVMEYNTLIMDVNLPGKHMSRISVGQDVKISNYNEPDSLLAGEITQVAPVLDPEGRTFKATVVVDNSGRILRPGMFVKAEVVVERSDSTIVIPKDIVMTRRNRQSVFVVERGVANERMITTGLENPDEVEVLEGLAVEDRLVIEGYETLRSRTSVRIVE